MVAYSFQKQFAEPIAAGTKRQTIRAERKRHARPGETLQLYTGMRTRHCRLVGTATCVSIGLVRLDLECWRVESLDTGFALTQLDELDAYAVLDGFADWRDLLSFWKQGHPGMPVWSGVVIRWGETFRPPVPLAASSPISRSSQA